MLETRWSNSTPSELPSSQVIGLQVHITPIALDVIEKRMGGVGGMRRTCSFCSSDAFTQGQRQHLHVPTGQVMTLGSIGTNVSPFPSNCERTFPSQVE